MCVLRAGSDNVLTHCSQHGFVNLPTQSVVLGGRSSDVMLTSRWRHGFPVVESSSRKCRAECTQIKEVHKQYSAEQYNSRSDY